MAIKHESPTLAGEHPDAAPSSAGAVEQGPRPELDYVWVPDGVFLMGGVPADDEAFGDEKPRRFVHVTKGYWMSRSPVTVAAYRRFADDTERPMPEEPPFNEDWSKAAHPIVNVSWADAHDYCEWAGGRLPTEAEWEYAARGGRRDSIYPWGDEEPDDTRARFGSNDGTSPVESYPANGFGLYDMAGCTWEWTADWYGVNYYKSSPARDPMGPERGDSRVVRGGSWNYGPELLRCSFRFKLEPSFRYFGIGFRCVREDAP